MGVEWGGRAPLVVGGSDQEWTRLKRLVAVAFAILVTVLLTETSDERVDDGVCTEGELCDSDGRYHPCGWVTEHGVTEHIDAYLERCGDTTLGGD